MFHGIFKALPVKTDVFTFQCSCNVNNKSTTIWLVQRLRASLARKPRDTKALLTLLGPQPEPLELCGCQPIHDLCSIYILSCLRVFGGSPWLLGSHFNHSLLFDALISPLTGSSFISPYCSLHSLNNRSSLSFLHSPSHPFCIPASKGACAPLSPRGRALSFAGANSMQRKSQRPVILSRPGEFPLFPQTLLLLWE